MMKQGIWSKEEHDCFLEAIKIYPQGPWRAISKFIGTRSVRQVQTHAQKYHEKIQRRMRGMHKDRKTWARTEHRIDQDLLDCCRLSEGLGIPMSSILMKLPEDLDVHATGGSFEQLLKAPIATPTATSPTTPPTVMHTRDRVVISDIDDGSVAIKSEFVDAKLAPLDELPSFSESLDFLIEYYSD